MFLETAYDVIIVRWVKPLADVSPQTGVYYMIIRILHKCGVLIEKSVPRVTVWHHEAPPTDDAKIRPEGQICRSVPHTHDRFFFLHTYGCYLN